MEPIVAEAGRSLLENGIIGTFTLIQWFVIYRLWQALQEKTKSEAVVVDALHAVESALGDIKTHMIGVADAVGRNVEISLRTEGAVEKLQQAFDWTDTLRTEIERLQASGKET